MVTALIAFVIGLGSGVASGAFGIGGAVLSTPAIRVLLRTSPLIAVGTTLPVIVPTALTGVWTYHRSKLVDLRLASRAAAAGATLAIVGALATRYVRGEYLLIATAALMLVLALQMLPKQRAGRTPPVAHGVPAYLIVGATSGLISGLLGVGGGIILVPAFTVLLQMPVKTAIGTSLAVVAAQAIPGTVVHALLHHIDWRIAAGLTVGVIPGARVGAKLAVAASDDRLRIVVALGLAGLALAFGANEVRGLLR